MLLAIILILVALLVFVIAEYEQSALLMFIALACQIGGLYLTCLAVSP